MARIRTIKPEFCTSRDFHKLTDSAKCFFMLLLCFLDDEGRAEYLPKKLAGDIYPLDEDKDAKTVRALVQECVDATMLLTYEVAGKEYLCAPNFNKHQTINRPAKSRFPSPHGETEDTLVEDSGEIIEDSGNTHGGLTEDSLSPHGALTTMQVLEVGNRKQEIGNRKEEVGRRNSADAAADFLDFVELVLVEPPRFASCPPPKKDSLAATISPHLKTHGVERLRAEILAWRDWHSDPKNANKGGKSNPLLSLKNWLDKPQFQAKTPPPKPVISAAEAEACAR